MIHSGVTHDPLDPSEVMRRVGAPGDGAVVLFVGTVRDHADGRPVTRMEYEGYREMAESVLREIATEAAEIAASDRVAVVHRLGSLEIGEASVVIAVSSAHRGQAYAASRHVIEEIKKRLPVWKKEHYADGPSRWVRGTTPVPTPEESATGVTSGP